MPLWPLPTRKNISTYISETRATHMGQMQQIRKILRSTKQQIPLYVQNLETKGMVIIQEAKCDEAGAQKLSPHNQRANVAERMIETGKHHFISGIAGTDENFPITQWDRLIPQTQRTLNMMRPFRINPKHSAESFLEGHHDYNSVPFPPLGWRMLIFEGPDQRIHWVSMQ